MIKFAANRKSNANNKAKNKGIDQKKDKQGLVTNYFKKDDELKWI